MIFRRHLESMRPMWKWYSNSGAEEIDGYERIDRLFQGHFLLLCVGRQTSRRVLRQLLNLHSLVDFLEGRFCDSGGTFAAGVNDLIDLG